MKEVNQLSIFYVLCETFIWKYISPFQIGMHCQDIDECDDNNTCPPPGICENSFGAFICTCPPGYKLNAQGNACEDINECQESEDFCANGICQNLPGSAKCQCPPG